MDHINKKLRELKTLEGPFHSICVDSLPKNPYDLFLKWFESAVEADVREPHSMTLSTVDENGYPDARILILKNVDEDGWYFASSSNSRKGLQIQNNPKVSLTFYWPAIGRQVRIRGTAVNTGSEASAKDFLERGKVARAIALTGKQSSILNEKEQLEDEISLQLNRLNREPGLVSAEWALYRVEADEAEFWQGDEERKHTRIYYSFTGGEWVRGLLWP